MANNIEIKARLADRDRAHARAQRLSGGAATLIEQEDTFFVVPRGRLKLRRFGDGRGELIAYSRPDVPGPKRSEYHIHPTANPGSLLRVLEDSLGIRGVVKKRRSLYLVGNTRIHIDEVEGLGHFLELEVVLQPGQTADEGRAIAESLMAEFGIQPEDLIEGAYIDLLERPRA